MKSDKKFKRQCCHCKSVKSKEELIRITKDFSTEEVKINNDGKISGRSVYICKNNECIENALKKKKIGTLLHTNIPENIKKELYNLLTS